MLDDKIRIQNALSRGKDVPDITRWDLIGINGKLTLSPKEPIICGEAGGDSVSQGPVKRNTLKQGPDMSEWAPLSTSQLGSVAHSGCYL